MTLKTGLADGPSTPSHRSLARLRRSDKWYLGAAGAVLWAPPFPRYLDQPGFWDRAHFYRYPVEPVFAVTLLDERGNPLPLQANERRWQPGELWQRYLGPEGLLLDEMRVVTPDDCLVSVLCLANGSGQPRRLRLAQWTCLPGPAVEGVAATGQEASFRRRLVLEGLPSLTVAGAFGLRLPARAGLALAEYGASLPDWRLCALNSAVTHDRWPISGKLASPGAPFVHLAIVAEIDVPAGGVASTVAATALALDEATASQRLAACLTPSADPLAQARQAWRDAFAHVPHFACSDSFFEQAYWYRWYGLHLLTIERPALNYHDAVVCEGIDVFRAPISYSAQCHVREVRWQHTPALAQGILQTFARHQRPDGSLPGLVPPLGELPEVFYHADWGSAVLALHQVHPDQSFLAELYPSLARYGRYLEAARDPDGRGLCEVWNHYETGQEYASRYLFADPSADRQPWGRVFRLYGVDASVYAYQTYRALAVLARELGRTTDTRHWQRAASRAGRAIVRMLWDPDQQFFVDALPQSLARSPSRAAVGLYPFMTDLVGPQHLGALRRLLDPAEFWTPFPVPTASRADPCFSAEGDWRGVRRNCPWNGRVWPMANSHVAEALVNAAERLDAMLLPAAADFLRRFIRLLFFDQDPSRPNCFEHYHPETGQPSAYRGIDDYQHSWLVDLIIRFVCGLRVDGPALAVRPLPLDLDAFELSGVPWHGHSVAVAWHRRRGLRLWVDGALQGQRSDLGPL